MHKKDITTKSRLKRVLWNVVYSLLFRPTPNIFFGWRRFILRLFGARIGARARIYPSCIIWDPANLIMGCDSCIGSRAIVYNVDSVELGNCTVISQDAYLCTATKSFWTDTRDLLVAPIKVMDNAWVAADVFVCPGVTIGSKSVVLARCFVSVEIPAGHVMKMSGSEILEKLV